MKLDDISLDLLETKCAGLGADIPQDPYRQAAAKVFNIEEMEVANEQRNEVKRAYFRVWYSKPLWKPQR